VPRAMGFVDLFWIKHSPHFGTRRCCTGRNVNSVRMAAGRGLVPRDDVLKHARHHGVEENIAARVVDVAERALKEFSVIPTHFLRPVESLELGNALGKLADLTVTTAGGFPQAERKRMVLSPVELVDLSLQIEEDEDRHFLTPVEIRGNFLFDPARHGDFLGAITGAGIDRDFIGDIILLGDRGAHVIVDPDIVAPLQSVLSQVRSVPVTVQPIEWDKLYYKEPKKRSINTVEKSMRLDSVGSAGFGISRTKIGDEIKTGNVLVNWKQVKNGSSSVKEGDIITFRGKGRVVVENVSKTSKNKFRIELSRYT